MKNLRYKAKGKRKKSQQLLNVMLVKWRKEKKIKKNEALDSTNSLTNRGIESLEKCERHQMKVQYNRNYTLLSNIPTPDN